MSIETAPRPQSNIFGSEVDEEEALMVGISMPVDITTSYGAGTCDGPNAIIKGSHQLDVCDSEYGEFDIDSVHLTPSTPEHLLFNAKARAWAIEARNIGIQHRERAKIVGKVNEACATFQNELKQSIDTIHARGQFSFVVGGDHSVPLAHILKTVEKHPTVGVLHIDAHADLRDTYEGFEHSHASIMHNVLKKSELQTLVQVGIRDFSREEYQRIQHSDGRIVCHFDQAIQRALHEGQPFSERCDAIMSALPSKVYISFDIDGLSPDLCPNTGTPVPGGLSFPQAQYLLRGLRRHQKTLVGFDLCEVSPGPMGEWDANVGARILLELLRLAS